MICQIALKIVDVEQSRSMGFIIYYHMVSSGITIAAMCFKSNWLTTFWWSPWCSNCGQLAGTWMICWRCPGNSGRPQPEEWCLYGRWADRGSHLLKPGWTDNQLGSKPSGRRKGARTNCERSDPWRRCDEEWCTSGGITPRIAIRFGAKWPGKRRSFHEFPSTWHRSRVHGHEN